MRRLRTIFEFVEIARASASSSVSAGLNRVHHGIRFLRPAERVVLRPPQLVGLPELVQQPQDLVVVLDVVGGELQRDHAVDVRERA